MKVRSLWSAAGAGVLAAVSLGVIGAGTPASAAGPVAPAAVMAPAASTAASWEATQIPLEQSAGDVTLTPDGKKAYVPVNKGVRADGDGEAGVAVIDTATGKTVTTIANERGGFDDRAVMSPDGKSLYTASWDGVTVIDTATDTVRSYIPAPGAPNGGGMLTDIAVDAGGLLYILEDAQVMPGGRWVSVVDPATGSVISSYSDPRGGSVSAEARMAVSPDGNHVYINNAAGPLDYESFFSLDTTSRQWQVHSIGATAHRGSAAGSIALSPDGSRLYLWAASGAGTGLHEVETATMTPKLINSASTGALHISRDGKTLYAATADANGAGFMEVDTSSFSIRSTASAEIEFVRSLTASPEGGHVYAVNRAVEEFQITDFTRS
ncbi:beta-propeller fold lactonase family protein [Streptomyces sp. NPDC008121]|uniref:beta-propeller fold lactonase family protein n=1 Tax=Streptomyces sp. NPDC008121 TaxID=3364809 RepID=UPI0036E4E754